MLWRWFQDWRERRSTLKELQQLRRADEASIMDQNLNPIYLAKTALDRGHDETAAMHWDEARRLVPEAIFESDDSLAILLGLKRFDEAEALMHEGLKRTPRDRRWLAGLARVSEARGDYAEALTRWRAAHGGSTSNLGSTEAWVHEGLCLRLLGQIDAAEVVFKQIVRREPTEMAAWLQLAKISDDRRDWPEAEVRWRGMTERFPIGDMFVGHAQALIELGRLDEANTILTKIFATLPGNLAIAHARAQLAEQQGDLSAACELWAVVHHVDPYFEAGYSKRAQCLSNAGRDAEADAVMRDAIARFPDADWPLRQHAELARRRQDWPEAATRWAAFRRRFPDLDEGYNGEREALNAAGRHAEAAAVRRVT